MTKYISIDPGRYKCGFVFADSVKKKVLQAKVILCNSLVDNIKELRKSDENIKVIIGNGTSSREHIQNLEFLKNDLFIAEEKNTTYRAKSRFFEIFPINGIKRYIPREIFIYNLNLDAISAIIILEDYLKLKFDIDSKVNPKTWLK
tara:strand:+ start:1090 stop:1527 length:438 start_codon:yes stop_codon:yes gene_type:complete